MKKMNLSKLCHAISILFLLVFIIHTIVDYDRYHNADTLTSAPFYLLVVVNAVCLIVPAVAAFVAGVAIRKTKKGKVSE